MEKLLDAFDYFCKNDAEIFEVKNENNQVAETIYRADLVDMLLKNRKNSLIGEVKMFLTDCDGCLTDAGMYYSENGDELKKFNTKDGMGFALLRERGIITGIITGEDRELNRRRAAKLKLDIIESGCMDKLSTVKRLCEEYNCKLEEVVYIGDDINDLECIKNVGLGCCPQDANLAVKKEAKYITKAKGGEGVIREIVDIICR